jgi:hypothetical protein
MRGFVIWVRFWLAEDYDCKKRTLLDLKGAKLFLCRTLGVLIGHNVEGKGRQGAKQMRTK